MQTVTTCPACRHTDPQPFHTCPACQVIVGKYLERAAERVQREQSLRPDIGASARKEEVRQSEPYHGPATKTRKEQPRMKSVAEANTDKYPALAVILLIAKAVAILPVIGSAVSLLFISQKSAAFGALCISVVALIATFALVESAQIFIDMESNQRKIIRLLEKQGQ